MTGRALSRSAVAASLVATVAALPACMTDHFHELVLAPRELEPGEEARLVRHPAIVEGTDRTTLVCVFVRIPWFDPSVEDALADALSQVPGAVALADAEIEYGFFSPVTALVFGTMWWRVRGTPLVPAATGPAATSGGQDDSSAE